MRSLSCDMQFSRHQSPDTNSLSPSAGLLHVYDLEFGQSAPSGATHDQTDVSAIRIQAAFKRTCFVPDRIHTIILSLIAHKFYTDTAHALTRETDRHARAPRAPLAGSRWLFRCQYLLQLLHILVLSWKCSSAL